MSADVPRETELLALKERRLGRADASCSRCRHAYPMRVTLKDSVLECREGPPGTLWAASVDPRIGKIVGMIIEPNRYVPNIVGPNYFCSHFAADPAQES